ncbi:MAG: 6-phosphogluconolactonase, partial [Marinobacter sp.]|nr:6-phosphogluconolactonase [Marinobacter sp.]
MKMSDLRLPEGVSDRSGETADGVALDLADAVAGFLAARLREVPRASLVVSGGSTPLPFFRALSGKDLD